MPDEPTHDDLERMLKPHTPARIAQVFGGQLAPIASLFQLDDSDASCERLAQVLIDYVKYAPEALVDLDTTARAHQIDTAIAHYTALAQNDITQTYQALQLANRLPSSAESLLSLLQNAYFVLRLLEELNDCAENFMGIPITGDNPMTANIIVHAVIGDRFANRLDSIVESTIQPSRLTKAIVEAQLDRDRVNTLRQNHCARSGQPVRDFVDAYGISMF